MCECNSACNGTWLQGMWRRSTILQHVRMHGHLRCHDRSVRPLLGRTQLQHLHIVKPPLFRSASGETRSACCRAPLCGVTAVACVGGVLPLHVMHADPAAISASASLSCCGNTPSRGQACHVQPHISPTLQFTKGHEKVPLAMASQGCSSIRIGRRVSACTLQLAWQYALQVPALCGPDD